MPAQNCNKATFKARISNLKFRAQSFQPARPLQFLITEQIRPDLLRDQINKTIANRLSFAMAAVTPNALSGINNADAEKSKRGPGYTNVEDMIVARSFISASENAICGAHQKGKVFKAHMFEIYCKFIKEQMDLDKALLERSSEATRDEYARKGVGNLYPDRSGESIYNRFKSAIAPEVMKFMGIHETTDMASGWSVDDHKTACLEFYKKRYGRPFDFFAVYEYLRDKNKFSSFRTKTEEELLGKRPIGKKKARQVEADAKLVKAVISEVIIKKEGGGMFAANHASKGGSCAGNESGIDSLDVNGAGMMGEVLQNISNVIANVGSAFMENMKAEHDMRLVQSLDTPDRKAFAKEQMALRIAETREKRRRLEADIDAEAQG